MYSAYTKQMMQDFGDRYRVAICSNIIDTDLFLAAVCGQLSAESNWGTSAPGNNFAGIHATGSEFSSGTQQLDTTEVINGNRVPVKGTFATYDSFDMFMKDYVRVLQLDSYVNAGVFLATTPEDQVLAIAKGGYSTLNPTTYLNNCRGRIEAARDLFKIGKISSNVTQPTVEASGTTNQQIIDTSVGGAIASIGSSIFQSLNGIIKAPVQ